MELNPFYKEFIDFNYNKQHIKPLHEALLKIVNEENKGIDFEERLNIYYPHLWYYLDKIATLPPAQREELTKGYSLEILRDQVKDYPYKKPVNMAKIISEEYRTRAQQKAMMNAYAAPILHEVERESEFDELFRKAKEGNDKAAAGLLMGLRRGGARRPVGYKVSGTRKYSEHEIRDIFMARMKHWIDLHYHEADSFGGLQDEVARAYYHTLNNAGRTPMSKGFRTTHKRAIKYEGDEPLTVHNAIAMRPSINLMDGSRMMGELIAYYQSKVAANEVATAMATATRKGGRRRRTVRR